MSYYVWGSNISYFDYLQARSFEESFKSEISESTRSIVASIEELQQQNIAVMETVSKGIDQLSFDIRELTVTVQWGFSELLTSVGRVNDALTELIRIAKTPAQVWAYEQFEIARDAFRQGLYQDALECLDRAINGYSGNPGHKLEYRFHYLLGTIRLGSFQNSSKDVVSLPEAENAFMNAAKYARADHPKEAGQASLAAGWAAYCQGKMTEASQYSKQAVSLDPELAEGYFQLAKIQMHVGAAESALPNLERAIVLDRKYSIKAAGDDDFKRYEAQILALLEILRSRARQDAETLLAETQRQATETETRHIEDFSLPKYVELKSVMQIVNDAASAARHNTYFGYLDAACFCRNAKRQFDKAVAQFKERANSDALTQITRIDERIRSVKSGNVGAGWVAIAWLGIILSFVLGCQSYNRVSQANDRQKQIRLDAAHKQMDELRSKGYDPAKLTVQQADKILGYSSIQSLPPWDTGSSPFGSWFASVLGVSFLAILLAWAGDRMRRTKAIAPLERDKLRLSQIRSQLGYT